MDKTALRSLMRARRGMMTIRPCQPESGAMLAGRLLAMASFKRARHVGAYLALPGEMPTSEVVKAVQDAGIAVSVPAWCRATSRYAFARLWPDCALEPGPMRVCQPGRPCWTPPGQIEVVLVPGLAFDEDGRRLGWGGGHYDRLLARLNNDCPRIGMAWEWQIVERVPVREHDANVHWIMTDKRLLACIDQKKPRRR